MYSPNDDMRSMIPYYALAALLTVGTLAIAFGGMNSRYQKNSTEVITDTTKVSKLEKDTLDFTVKHLK